MADESQSGQSPAESLRDHLKPVGGQFGLEFEDGSDEDARILPQVDLGWPVGRRLARELGQLISRCGIFRQGGRIVTVDALSGDVESMTEKRFTTWVEKFVTTVKWRNGDQQETTMADTLAGKILAADQFRDTLRELKGVHPVRMPVLRESGKVELLSPGYDEESQIFTVETVKYDQDLPIDDAREVFVDLLQAFPWADLGSDPNALFRNRSVSVQVAAMLGTYCRGMFPPGTKRPMITYIANQPGTGKSLLAVMALSAVFGHVTGTVKPRDEEKFGVLLETVAQTFSPYLFLDDIANGIFSNSLNSFLTRSYHGGRKFHKNDEMFHVPNVTQVYATGNGIELTPDLQRRTLVVDMFLPGEVRGRTFENRLTDDVLAAPDLRKRVLAAMWAVVRDWSDAGAVRVQNPLETFEEWTCIVGALTRFAGFSDPLEVPDLPDGGDKQGRTWRHFLGRLAGEGILPGEAERSFTVQECLEKAEEMVEANEIEMEDLVGHAKDQNKAFGRRMAKWKGRHITDTRGRVVQFGKRRQDKARVYECEVIAS